MTEKIDVSIGTKTYPIYIGHNLLKDTDILCTYVLSKQVVIISDSTVADLYLAKLRSKLVGKESYEFIIPPGEESKNLAYFEQIISFMLEKKINRSATIIALGGGVVGDIAGFVAASYQRGIKYIQVPTTLLSQVDSSVGGKTAVNHSLGKNMIGAFYQPIAVIADTATLATLSERDFNAGVAEVIKYGLIKEYSFLKWINDNITSILSYDETSLNHIVKLSCQTKAKIVELDERENGIRAILNLGHTFGHAIETFVGYGNWLHGEAIAAGMVMAANMSLRLGYLDESELEIVVRLLQKCSLPTQPPQAMRPQDFLDLMSRDKKNHGNSIRLILLKNLGEAFITDEYPKEVLAATLKSYDNL
jgi:3-dehydroquinate synthase